MRAIVYILILTLAGHLVIHGQSPETAELSLVLKAQDSLLFQAAFDTCDEAIMSSYFTEDFEFYHDRSGITEGKEAFMEGFRDNCAARVAGAPQPSKRILVPNSLQVFPMKNNGELYGAIQHGIHEFEFLNAEGNYQKGDIARFTHVWILENGKWKIRRELSYDHQSRNGQSSP